jgi:SAM-dependent methyltransferase
MYRRKGSEPLVVPWWECRQCRGWFAYPVPSVDDIRKNWCSVAYADPQMQPIIAGEKEQITRRLLDGLEKLVPKGSLLDVGCSTGLFMLAAREAGWTPAGWDPNEAALNVARQHGLDVTPAWHVDECGYPSGSFQAVTAIDVFYYSWNPFRDLHSYCRVLRPGGVLAMRISNKRFVLGCVKRLMPAGSRCDARLSRMLQGQFHSIALGSLTRALQTAGFCDVEYEPHAATAQHLSWKSWLAYSTADLLRWTTFCRLDLSPGVLVYAKKA